MSQLHVAWSSLLQGCLLHVLKTPEDTSRNVGNSIFPVDNEVVSKELTCTSCSTTFETTAMLNDSTCDSCIIIIPECDSCTSVSVTGIQECDLRMGV